MRVFRVKITLKSVVSYDGARCATVYDAYDNPIDVTAPVAQELCDEMRRIGRYLRATLLFDEEQYLAVEVLETRGPNLFYRILRFFERQKP